MPYTLSFESILFPTPELNPDFAAFEMYEGDSERLAVGNALNAWAYGAFNVADAPKTNFNIFETGNTNNTAANYGIDLHSSKPVAGFEYELPRKGIERTIIFKVQYVPGGKDLVTVWMDPDLGPGTNEGSQRPASPPSLRRTPPSTKCACAIAAAATAGFSVRWPSRLPSATLCLTTAASLSEAAIAVHVPRMAARARVAAEFRARSAQTKDGYIWAGSDAGVSRFDGARFVSFGSPEGFKDGPVQTLLGDSQGALGSAASAGDWVAGKMAVLPPSIRARAFPLIPSTPLRKTTTSAFGSERKLDWRFWKMGDWVLSPPGKSCRKTYHSAFLGSRGLHVDRHSRRGCF